MSTTSMPGDTKFEGKQRVAKLTKWSTATGGCSAHQRAAPCMSRIGHDRLLLLEGLVAGHSPLPLGAGKCGIAKLKSNRKPSVRM